jgi:hypothetical protein
MQEVLNANAIHDPADRNGAVFGGWRPVMKHRTPLALLATLVAGTAMAQDVSVSTTTIAQTWKQNTPGFSTGTFTPATEYVGIVAVKLGGKDALSLHFYGWGMADLADQSYIGGKSTGDFTYGYLQYNFAQANAQLKAGRFSVTQGIGNEPVDGVSASTDLRCGFTVSAFAGTPVIFKNYSNQNQSVAASQRDFMFGGRLAWHAAKVGEIGVDYLEDGSSPATQTAPAPATNPTAMVYTRRLLGVDMKLTPCDSFDFSGRTVTDVAPLLAPAAGINISRLAEDDYTATLKFLQTFSLAGTFVERNLFSYFAGSTLPSLFNQNEQGMFKATGAKLTWQAPGNLQVVGDVRRTDRESYGTTTRGGADLRYTLPESHILAGVGFHKVNAAQVQAVDLLVPAYSLSHSEARAWIMAEKGAYSASLDAIRLHYADPYLNPSLNGQSIESAIVGSVGYKAKNGAKVSGDLTLEDSPIFGKQTIALLRLEYRFGLAGKGDK